MGTKSQLLPSCNYSPVAVKMNTFKARAMLEHGANYPRDDGSAGIIITLSKGTIEVRHKGDNILLARAKDVPEGAWQLLWDTLYSIGCERHP